MKTLVNQAYDSKRSVKQNGMTKKMSKKVLMFEHLSNMASSGDFKAIDRSIPLLERYGPQEDVDGPTVSDLKPDMEVLRLYLDWYDLINSSENDNDGDDDDVGDEREPDHG